MDSALLRPAFHNMQVNHGRSHIRMAKKILHRSDIGPIFQQMGGKRMPQRMTGHPLGDAGLIHRSFKLSGVSQQILTNGSFLSIKDIYLLQPRLGKQRAGRVRKQIPSSSSSNPVRPVPESFCSLYGLLAPLFYDETYCSHQNALSRLFSAYPFFPCRSVRRFPFSFGRGRDRYAGQLQ